MTELNKGKLKYDDLKDTENHEIGLRLHSFNSWLLSFSCLARYRDQCWHWTSVRSYKLPVQWYGVFKRWSLILCNFPEYPRLRGSPGYSLVSRPGAPTRPTSSSLLITEVRGRECKFYNLSVIIWWESDFWRVSCHNVTVRAACLIPGDGETELFGNKTSSIIMFMTINDCFLRGSGSNYYTIIILLISPEKPTKTGKWWHHWVRRCPGYRADGNSAVWSWVVTLGHQIIRMSGCQMWMQLGL